MTYTKLFGSILYSTIWEAPDNVRLVWITMLAMKDRDGLVEASIPGLARAARQTIEATESALSVLMAPDPYSRTPDHEGRRIETIDGGWRVLNHDKYRDKENADERREKEAERKARYRARKGKSSRPTVSRNVPPCPAVSTKVTASDTDTDTDPDRARGPDLGGPVVEASPDPGGAPRVERERLRLPEHPGALDRASAQLRRPPIAPSPEMTARRQLNEDTWDRLNRRRVELAQELRLPPPRHLHDGMMHRTQWLRERITESGQHAAGDIDHVFAIREAEVRASRSLQYFSGSMFNPEAWQRALAMDVGDVRGPKTDNAFDVIDETTAAIERARTTDDPEVDRD